VVHVDRSRNQEADALAKAAAKGEATPSDVFFDMLTALRRAEASRHHAHTSN
jgi:hypothetical protein